MFNRWRISLGWLKAAGLYLLLMLLLAIAGQHSLLLRQHQQSEAQAERLSAFIRYEIGRYAGVAAKIADSTPLQTALAQHNYAELNQYLLDLQRASQSADIYLMDPSGLVLASSNFQTDSSYVGHNFAFRPYVQAAQQGKAGQYYALGHTSGRRGYYYSAPIRQQNKLLGIITVKIDLEPIEQQQQAIAGLNGWHFLVTGQSDEVFLSDVPSWRFRQFSAIALTQAEQQRYLTQPIQPLGQQKKRMLLAPAFELWQMPLGNEHVSFLPYQQPIAAFGWQLILLQKPQSAPLGWLLSAGTLVLMSIGLAWLWWRERRRRIGQLQQHNQVLEQRVLARTSELADANQRLVAQIARREQTESALAQTEQELVQAAKLATIGSLSASLNHELNQPLTALQSYCQNTSRMLDKNMQGEAQANVAAMLKLIQRLSNIVAQFKDFSRPGGGGKNQTQSLQKIVLDALGIVQHQCQRQGVKTKLKQPEQQVMVLLDPIQLEQVLVNILTNGLQAMQHSAEPGFSVVLEVKADQAYIRIRDYGPGIEPHHLERIFEAFFSTKQRDGLGLGLSISQRIIQSIGGSLSVANHPDQGAEFTIQLPLYQATRLTFSGEPYA